MAPDADGDAVTLQVHTARMGHRGPDILPVTRKIVVDPVGVLFAPSAAILDRALSERRAGRLEAHWPVYVAAYEAEMRACYRAHRAAWEALLARSRVVLPCFCTDATRCHRTVLAGLLARCGADNRGEVTAAPTPSPEAAR